MSATDQEIFDQAIGEPPVESVPVETPEVVEEKSEGRVRDEKGRFVSATPEPEEATPEPQPVDEKPAPKDEDGARVPSWRLAEEAERRRSAEQALNELRNEIRQLQMQRQVPQAPEQPQEVPDIFADPNGFVQNLQSSFDQRLKALQLENSLRFAHYAHGDKFTDAYQEFMNHVQTTRDQATYQRVMASTDPGEAMVKWWGEQQLQKELGGSDLKTFLEKQREEWLKDPNVQKQVIEAFKATQSTSQPSNLTNLPPSLSKAAAARSAHDDGGSSGNDMYAYATAKR
jgi:hypothetical protein